MVKSSLYLKVKSENKYICYHPIIDIIIMRIIMSHIMLFLFYKSYSINSYNSWSFFEKKKDVVFSLKELLKIFLRNALST